MYSNNILNFQESTTILNACTKKIRKLIEGSTEIYFALSISKQCSLSLRERIRLSSDNVDVESKVLSDCQFHAHAFVRLKLNYSVLDMT